MWPFGRYLALAALAMHLCFLLSISSIVTESQPSSFDGSHFSPSNTSHCPAPLVSITDATNISHCALPGCPTQPIYSQLQRSSFAWFSGLFTLMLFTLFIFSLVEMWPNFEIHFCLHTFLCAWYLLHLLALLVKRMSCEESVRNPRCSLFLFASRYFTALGAIECLVLIAYQCILSRRFLSPATTKRLLLGLQVLSALLTLLASFFGRIEGDDLLGLCQDRGLLILVPYLLGIALALAFFLVCCVKRSEVSHSS